MQLKIIGALVIFLVEAIAGNTKTAVTNIHSALAIINQKIVKLQRSCNYNSSFRTIVTPYGSDPIEEGIPSCFSSFRQTTGWTPRQEQLLIAFFKRGLELNALSRLLLS